MTANWTSGEAPREAALQALRREASIMASLRHPNCVQYLGCCLDPPALVMEYCSRRSVDQILQEARDDPKSAKQLDWFRLLSIATDAAKGMLYLHSRNPPIVHRDLKSPNLLVDGQWHVKISDFNLSRAMEQDSLVSSLQITNPRWLAPEILRGEKGGKASDVYSFGVVLWELLTWKLPWDGEKNPFSIINRVLQKKSLAVPGCKELPAGELEYYEAYVLLMKRCWEWDPVDRPTMDSIVQELRTLLAAMLQSKIDTTNN
jgi:serine/threonine protein kinase